MKTYIIKIGTGTDRSLQNMVEYLLRGVSLGLVGPNKLDQTAAFDGKCMFRTNCSMVVWRISLELSNYGLCVEAECACGSFFIPRNGEFSRCPDCMEAQLTAAEMDLANR